MRHDDINLEYNSANTMDLSPLLEEEEDEGLEFCGELLLEDWLLYDYKQELNQHDQTVVKSLSHISDPIRV